MRRWIISSEPEHIKKLYGVDDPKTRDYAIRCITARRLVERGVRFSQVLNYGQSWDQHGSLISALPRLCYATDKPCAALIMDLKQLGLLDSTVVHWGGEMGRLPVLQNDAGQEKWGRDHNTYGFSQWAAGGGFKAGYVHGETDEWGHKAVKDVVNHYDWHATLLLCFGLDHTQLTYKRNGTTASLIDGQDAQIVKGCWRREACTKRGSDFLQENTSPAGCLLVAQFGSNVTFALEIVPRVYQLLPKHASWSGRGSGQIGSTLQFTNRCVCYMAREVFLSSMPKSMAELGEQFLKPLRDLPNGMGSI